MSQSINCYADGKVVTITYVRKVSKTNSYVQFFLNIRVVPSNDNAAIYQLDIDHDYAFTHFGSIKDFFQHLKKMKKKDQTDIVRFQTQDCLAFPILGESGEIQEQEIIELSHVEIVTLKELEEVEKRVDFYNSFKNKMIHKIEKVVQKHYKNDHKPSKTTEKKHKKQPAMNSQSQFMFSLSTQQYQQIHTLNRNSSTRDFIVDLSSLQLSQFRIRVKTFNFDKVNVGIECFRGEEDRGRVRRVCQFGRSPLSTFWVEEGQELGVSLEDGEIVIRNVQNNGGKMFDNLYEGSESDWKCRILLGLSSL